MRPDLHRGNNIQNSRFQPAQTSSAVTWHLTSRFIDQRPLLLPCFSVSQILPNEPLGHTTESYYLLDSHFHCSVSENTRRTFGICDNDEGSSRRETSHGRWYFMGILYFARITNFHVWWIEERIILHVSEKRAGCQASNLITTRCISR